MNEPIQKEKLNIKLRLCILIIILHILHPPNKHAHQGAAKISITLHGKIRMDMSENVEQWLSWDIQQKIEVMKKLIKRKKASE